MINKQLEVNINRENLLENLANNLNIDFITEGSGLKKIADLYSAENQSFASSVDEAISNGFLLTMTPQFLELFGQQNNIHRKNYKSVSIYAHQEAAWLSINKTEAMVNEITQEELVYNKGSVIFSNDDIVIESLSDVYIDDINANIPVSVRITVSAELDNYVIEENNEFQVTPSNKYVVNMLPYLTLKFTRPVGLSVLQEVEEDYRLRIYEATYLANNGANSLMASLTKEVPYLLHLETDNYKDGRAIRVIYPYTQTLIQEGIDTYIETLLIPLIESNLKGKVLHGQLIEVVKPEALLLRIDLTLKKDVISNSVILNTKDIFNNFYSTYKRVTRQELEDFIYLETGLKKSDVVSLDFVFISPYVSEESFTLTASTPPLDIPIGRFLHLNTINKIIENRDTNI